MQTIIEFCQQFVNEQACVDYLENARWRGQVECPLCAGQRVYHCSTRFLLKCAICQKQFNVRTGTILGDSRLPLRKWFIAIYLLDKEPQIASSIQIAKRLDITQKSAWKMLKKLSPYLDVAPNSTSPDFDEVVRRVVTSI